MAASPPPTSEPWIDPFEAEEALVGPISRSARTASQVGKVVLLLTGVAIFGIAFSVLVALGAIVAGMLALILVAVTAIMFAIMAVVAAGILTVAAAAGLGASVVFLMASVVLRVFSIADPKPDAKLADGADEDTEEPILFAYQPSSSA